MARINLTQAAYIGNVSSPEGPTDVTTKGYVDARISTASPSAPTAPVAGALWVDTSTSPYVLKVYFNSLWMTLSSVVASDFTYTSTASAVTITGYTGTGGAVTIPSSIGGLPVTNIGNNAFENKQSITSLTISNSVTSIGNGAFQSCTGLTSVTIPSSVTSIGDYAFYGCSNLLNVAIPNTVTSIGSAVFEMCVGIVSVTIGTGINNISSRMFANCPLLASITIPSNITSIGANSLQNCIALTNVTIPNSVTTIGGYAFNQCTGLTTVTIGNGLLSIGNSFSSCTSLASVSFLGNVPTTTATWTGMTGTVYRLSAATGWGSTFAGRPVAITGSTVVDNGYTNLAGDFYVAPNGTDYYVQPTIATNAYTFNGDILTFQGDTLTFAA